MENLGEDRLVARSGAMLFAGAGLLTLVNSFALRALGTVGVDVLRLRILAVVSVLSALVVLVVPWSRLAPRASLPLAAWGLVLLLASGSWAGYAATGQARAAFPIFFILIFGWMGLTQPRGASALFAPIVVVGCGWLVVSMRTETVSFAGSMLALGTSVLIAETIAWAMARTRRHAGDLAALVAASAELRDVLTLAEGADLAARSTRVVLHADRVEMRLLESVPMSLGPLSPAHDSLLSAATRSGEICSARDALAIPFVGPTGVIAVAVVTGVSGDPVTGQLVRLLSSEFGGRLEQLRLLEALGEQTLRDALTGVGSRRHADALVGGLQAGDSLLLIDVDHFKDVNDAHGHLGGDRLLERLGAHLRAGLRDHDCVARYGGDEFLVRLRAHEGDSYEIARRLLDTWTAGGDGPTFSVGIATHRPDASPESTFAEADQALYASKNAGRAHIAVR